MLFPPALNAAPGSASPQALLAAPPPDIEYAETVEKGHGRIEVRRLALSREIVPHLGWPGAARVCRIERTLERAGKTGRAVSYAVTSLPRFRIGPEELLAFVREHWGVENRLHYRRAREEIGRLSLRWSECRRNGVVEDNDAPTILRHSRESGNLEATHARLIGGYIAEPPE